MFVLIYKTGGENMNKFRSFLYKFARILGDLNAVKKGKPGRRIGRRVTGRATGKLFRRIFK